MRLTCLFGTADLLIPAEAREAIGASLSKLDSTGQRLRCVEYARAEDGFICEDLSRFNAQASAQGWSL